MIDFGAYTVLEDDTCRVMYHQNVFSSDKSDDLVAALHSEINFRPDTLKIFGKTITTQRQYSWHGDELFDYAYSGQSRIAKPWTPALVEIRDTIEKLLNTRFNCCLLNRYEDGTQGMAWHSDDEKVMEENGIIASVSLGADRIFEFKHKTTDSRKRVLLENGSVLLMLGETQKYYLHQLPKSKKIQASRVNLTFRRFVKT